MMVKIDNDRLLDLASQLVRIRSENPTGKEKEIADMLARNLPRNVPDAVKPATYPELPSIDT